ncbi:MAG: DUF692 domain-containing protein [Pyrinomonadaceae bacterium]|nr:DUF692 domain-containing protein [Pyrinomonadaceae bacterium]
MRDVLEKPEFANQLSKTKIGLGFRPQLKSDIFLYRNEIDFLEITADHYFDATPQKLAELDLLKKHFQLTPHGLNLSLGSAEGIDENYLEKFAELVEKIQPEWFSDHICWTKSGGVEIGHLSPVPFTNEALKVLIRNITTVKNRIKTPLILENITYMFRYPFAEMDEAEFLTKILEETDSGLLLDVTNLYINSINHQYDWRKFLDKLPLERVVQLHFVGGHQFKNYLIDSHSYQTPNEIWEVYREVCSRADVKGAILERDGNFPHFSEILKELNTARALSEKANFSKSVTV